MKKITEQTYGTHVYMKVELDNGSIEEVDMYLSKDGLETYKTTKDNNEQIRNEIIRTFKELY